jgi:hypothetical protein
VNGSDILRIIGPWSVLSSLLVLLDPEEEGSVVLQEIGNHSPKNMVFLPRRLQFSNTIL